MSKLGSLFGGGSAESDSNDALRYVAPKEPKARQTTPAAKSAAAAPAPAKAAPASKFIATASVRLFKLNSSTNAYDAVAGGSPLGCIIVGAAATYQILIYNAQKAPQAIAPITSSFAYNIRDLYMSFTDAQGTNWSVLFDTSDALTSFAKAIIATIAHTLHHSNTSISTPIKGNLPPHEADGSAPLAVGSTAGITYQGWLLNNDIDDSPTDIMANSPFYSASSHDIAKVKVGPQSTEEPFAGLGGVLVNQCKGDRLMLVLPPSATRNTGYLLLEIEIVKVKSKEKEKKDKKEIVPITPVSAPVETSQDMTPPSPQRSGSLKDRMSYLSNQGGGGGGAAALASAMGGRGNQMHQQSDLSEQQDRYQPPPQQQYHQPPPQQQHQQQDRYQPPPQQQYNTPPPQQQHQQYGSQAPAQHYQPSYQSQAYAAPSQNHQAYSSYQPPEAQRYALTVVEGQGPRSYYADATPAAPAAPLAPTPVDTSAASSTIQQTLLALQSSMMAAHNKLDTLTAQSGNMVNYTNKSAVRMKSDEIISAIQSLVESCEKAENNSMSGRDRETIAKLEDKIDTLMLKNEKLSQEKSDLWEKHATHLQSAAENATKVFSLQQELDTLRRDRSQDLATIEALRLQIQHAGQNSEDKNKVSALESECRLLRTEKDALESQISQQLSTIRAMENDMRDLRQSLATIERDRMNEKLALESEVTALKAQLATSANASVDLQSDEVQSYAKQQVQKSKDEMQTALEALREEAAAAHRQSSDAVRDADKYKADAAAAEAKIQQLNKELETALAAKAVDTDNSEAIQLAMKEALQKIFEGMHEMFAEEEGEEPANYSSSDVLKRVKRVLKNAALK